MRRATIALLALLPFVLVLSLPREAAAQGWWRWIEQLSGPGPLIGPAFEVGLTCAQASGAKTPFCDTERGNTFKAAVRADIEWMWGKNNLTYAPGTDVPKNVHAFALLGAVDFPVQPWLELGAGVGFMRFSNTPADSFTKPAIEPIRVIVKPFAGKLRAIEFRYRGVLFPSGFTAADFGAVPGTFDVGTEFNHSFCVGINLVSVFR